MEKAVKPDGESAFNSSLEYLERISELMRSFHTVTIKSDNNKLMMKIVKELEMELTPRIRSSNYDTTEIDKWRRLAFSSWNVMTDHPRKLAENRAYVKNWFMELNCAAHSLGLILINKASDLGALDG